MSAPVESERCKAGFQVEPAHLQRGKGALELPISFDSAGKANYPRADIEGYVMTL